MALDPRIPLGVQPPQIANPFETLASMGQQRAQQQAQAEQSQIRQLQIQEHQQRAQQGNAEAIVEQRLRDLFSGEAAPSPQAIFSAVGPERGARIVQGLAALQAENQKQYASQQELIRDVLAGMDALPEGTRAEVYPAVRQNLLSRQLITDQDAPEQYDPAWFQQVRGFGQKLEQPKQPGTRQVETQNPDGTKTIQIVEDTAGQTFSSAAPPVSKGKHAIRVAGPNGQPMMKLFTDEELAAGVPAYVDPQAKDKSAKFWVIRDGKQIRISEEEYRIGDMNSSSREQGRPVSSGDTGKISDFNTSLDDVATLRSTVSGNKSTGTAALVGTKVPNWVTEMTGWGTDAKSKNAVIARVKQVIGKALEGGVLRKEDEYKDKDILPTIGDVADVVKTKLDGLEVAITKRRQTLLEDLTDSGYDTSQHQKRVDGETAPTGPKPTHRFNPATGKVEAIP